MFFARVTLSVKIRPLLLCVGLALSCAKREPPATLPKDDVIVAKVNGSPITRYDVEQIADRTLGNLSVAVSPDAYARIREAAVRSRALSLAMEAELSEVEKLALAKELSAYREQLLVRRYLGRHAPAAPVTPEMVRAYYNEHPERFGARVERSYDLLGSSRSLAPAERDKLLTALKDVEHKPDWQAFAEQTARAQLPLTYTLTSSSDPQLDQHLRDLMQQLEAGKVSPVSFVQGRLYVARVKGETRTPPRPFEQVGAEIEQLLKPERLSDAVERATKDIMSRTKVEILESPGSARKEQVEILKGAGPSLPKPLPSASARRSAP